MDSARDFGALQQGIQKSLVSTVKTVNRLAAEDLSFQRTVNPDTAQQLDDHAARALRLSTRLLRAAAHTCKDSPPMLEDAEDIDIKWQSVVDVVDSLLEKADTALDEFTGLIKRREPSSAEAAPTSKKSKSTAKVIRNANVSKPQAHFERKPENFPEEPWKPLITKKPHATVPLAQSFVMFAGEDGAPQYKHPYEAEISAMEYPERVYRVAEPIPPQPADLTSAIWVDTYEGVLDMLRDLKEASEIAVDLEHHDFRTYHGLVCLMQISTREKDWIVDTLQPWRHKLEVLNEVFADPKIVKVFHGAYMDMIWLQRDLGLYVNGLFDTFFACDILVYPAKSLAYLLSKFVNFDADKQYQLADWRIRPIPAEMLYYARSDTHFLLYIYDRLRNELVSASDRDKPEADYIGHALQRSRELALSRHEHPGYDEGTGKGPRGWYGFVLKQAHLGFDREQFAVFRALWKWRDTTARKEDESPSFVLGTHNMVNIVRVNPPDVKALHSLLPLTAPLARARFSEMWDRLREAKAQGGPTMVQFFASLTLDDTPKPAKVAPPADPSPMPEPGDDMGATRLTRSQLFGHMAISTRWEPASNKAKDPDEPFPFPWQRFVQAVGNGRSGDEGRREAAQATDVDATTPKVSANDAVEEHAKEDADEEFTLKRGKKRKSEAAEMEAAESSAEHEAPGGSADDQGADSDTNGMETDAAKTSKKKQRKKEAKLEERERAQRREERMARRAKKKQEREQQKLKEQRQQGDDETPFDYSKAASVLHGGQGAGGGAARERAKVFDPYAKTADEGLKGARKAPPVRGERSATFKK